MATLPFISIILCVRNGMPYVKDAVESLLEVDYPSYEVIVQDGASTDGTYEYLRQFESRDNWSLVSEADSGIGQGFNRAAQRCRGDLVGSIDADNRFYPNVLHMAVEGSRRSPNAAAVYGVCGMIDGNGEFVQTWIPPRFDLLGLVDGSVVPPFASSFFNRAICGDELRFDESMPIVPDFDLWLRLSRWPIVRVDQREPFVDVRIGAMSSTWRPNSYERQCELKVKAVERFLSTSSGDRLRSAWAHRAEADLYLWGVESLANIGAPQADIDRYFAKAAGVDVRSDRFRTVIARAKPSLRNAPPERVDELLEEGLARVRHGRYDDALLYFELLMRSNAGVANLAELAVHAKEMSTAVQIAKRDELILQCQQEINKRDEALVTRDRYFQGEIAYRDQLLAQKATEQVSEIQKRDTELDRLRTRVSQLERYLKPWRFFVSKQR